MEAKNQNNLDQRLSRRLARWNSGEFGSLWKVSYVTEGETPLLDNRIRDRVEKVCSSANLSPLTEKRNLIGDSASRPGENVVLDGRSFCCSWRYGDFFSATKHYPKCGWKWGYAIEAADDRKFRMYEQNVLSEVLRSCRIRWFVLNFQEDIKTSSLTFRQQELSIGGICHCIRRMSSVTLSSCNSWACGNVACSRASDASRTLFTRVKLKFSNAFNLGI